MPLFRKLARAVMPARDDGVVLARAIAGHGRVYLFENAPTVLYKITCALAFTEGGVLAFASDKTVGIWYDKGNVVDRVVDDEFLDGVADMKPFVIHPLPADDKNTGLWVSPRVTAFREDMGLNYAPGESEVDRYLTIADSGAVERDDGSIDVLAKDLNVVLSGRDLPGPPRRNSRNTSSRMDVDEFVFDAWHARAAVVAQFLARGERRARAKAITTAKRDHCSKCVYACTRRLGACELTDAEVVAEYPNTDDARAWMAAFKWSGTRANQGRSHVMAWAPSTTNINAPLAYVTRSLSPGYKRREDMAPEDVIGADWRERVADTVKSIAERSVDEQARLFFALRQLWAHGHYLYDAKFAQGQGGDDYRLSRNDVLYIKLDGGWNGYGIEVGSDTAASSWGGFGSGGHGRRSDSISHTSRPRFKTHYSHPFYENLLGWTGEPLGTKKSSIKLRII